MWRSLLSAAVIPAPPRRLLTVALLRSLVPTAAPGGLLAVAMWRTIVFAALVPTVSGGLLTVLSLLVARAPMRPLQRRFGRTFDVYRLLLLLLLLIF